MTYLSGKIIIELGKHRLHDRINNILIAVSSIAIASHYLVHGAARFAPGNYVGAGSILFDVNLNLPLHGPVEAAISNRKPDRIELELVASQPYIGVTHTNGLDAVIGYIAMAAFIEFFEAHKPWLEEYVAENPYKWPPILNFGRVVRNAFGHGNKIDFRNKNAAPVTWHKLSYDSQDDGREVFYKDIGFGDVLILMFEMSDALDKAGCPLY